MTKYCLKKNWPDVNVDVGKFKIFIAILVVLGYNPLPQKPLYWSKSSDVYCEAISCAMRRDRFDGIMQCMHFNARSDLDVNEKYAKLRPLT